MMIFWTCEKIGGHVNLTWSHVRRTCRNFSLFLSLLRANAFYVSQLLHNEYLYSQILAVVCIGLRWFAVVWSFFIGTPPNRRIIVPNSGGDLRWCVVVCGGLWWFALVCLLVIPHNIAQPQMSCMTAERYYNISMF